MQITATHNSRNGEVSTDLEDIEKTLLNMTASFAGQLPAEQLEDMVELIQHNERGIALENLCTQLDEYDVPLSAETLGRLRAIRVAMGMDDSPYCEILDRRE